MIVTSLVVWNDLAFEELHVQSMIPFYDVVVFLLGEEGWSDYFA